MSAASRLSSAAFSAERAHPQLSQVEGGGSHCARCGDEYSLKRKVSASGDMGAAPSICADTEMCARRISQLRLMGIA
jgi:hypothetical protein